MSFQICLMPFFSVEYKMEILKNVLVTLSHADKMNWVLLSFKIG